MRDTQKKQLRGNKMKNLTNNKAEKNDAGQYELTLDNTMSTEEYKDYCEKLESFQNMGK